ncbi:hypothetical protein AVEN_45215-1 [Araneus ventricosus]|uniref:Uncharacterized protein n=1 Tax=Araneus ventricosus TaxID=182803 RepID=A0A4Y2EA57_ARAVE|nr:hypothetical protein AVEN_45215-1 [Araneus ventricosus]
MHYFVRAERIGDRNLHLYSIQCMLVHLHAAGNIHYTKSAHLYLQNMSNLKTSLSDQDFERFVSEGYFTVRRSDKFWCGGRLVGHNYRAGQMLSMKVGSGLSQGRNTSDGVVARWIYTMPGSLQVTEQWEQSSFNQSEELISLSSGNVADERVNFDSAEELGENAAKGNRGKTICGRDFEEESASVHTGRYGTY